MTRPHPNSRFALLACLALIADSPAQSSPTPAPTPTADSASSGENPLPTPPKGHQWEPVEALSDEFDGDRLDSTKWQPRHPYWSGRDPSRFHPENVSVADGMLRLKTTSMVRNLSEVAKPMKDIWVHSACVTSRQRSARKGSYFECRFKASRLSATSSFWLQGSDREIDVVEQIGAPRNKPSQSHQMLMNTHLFVKKKDGKKDLSTPTHWTMPTGSADEFHTYAVWWRDEHHAWFYHNGEKVAEIEFPGSFDVPMYLFLDTEVFTWAGLPTIESLNDPKRNTMLVDWVRTWHLAPLEP